MHVGDQFEYSWGLLDDLSMGLFFATFRFSFAVVSVASVEASRLEKVPTNHPINLVRPGELLHRLERIKG